MPMEKKPFLSAKGLLLCALLLLAAGIACAALSLSPRGTLALVEVDGQVVLDPFVNGDHNYTSEDPATNTQLDADLRQVTVDFLTYHLQ